MSAPRLLVNRDTVLSISACNCPETSHICVSNMISHMTPGTYKTAKKAKCMSGNTPDFGHIALRGAQVVEWVPGQSWRQVDDASATRFGHGGYGVSNSWGANKGKAPQRAN